jgi:hypothetical protein
MYIPQSFIGLSQGYRRCQSTIVQIQYLFLIRIHSCDSYLQFIIYYCIPALRIFTTVKNVRLRSILQCRNEIGSTLLLLSFKLFISRFRFLTVGETLLSNLIVGQ